MAAAKKPAAASAAAAAEAAGAGAGYLGPPAADAGGAATAALAAALFAGAPLPIVAPPKLYGVVSNLPALPPALADAFGPSNYLYTFASRTASAVPPPQLDPNPHEKLWHHYAAKCRQHVLLQFVKGCTLPQGTTDPSALLQISKTPSFGADAVAADRARVRAVMHAHAAQVSADLVTARAAVAPLLAVLTPTQVQSVVSAAAVGVGGGAKQHDGDPTYLAMAELDALHALTTTTRSSSSSSSSSGDAKQQHAAAGAAAVSFVELSDVGAGRGVTHYLRHRAAAAAAAGGGSSSGSGSGGHGVHYGFVPPPPGGGAAAAATHADGSTYKPTSASAAGSYKDPLGWMELHAFSTWALKQPALGATATTAGTGARLCVSAHPGGVNNGGAMSTRLAAELRLVFDLTTALHVLEAGGHFVVTRLSPELFAAAAGDEEKGKADGGGGVPPPLLVSVLAVCYALFESVALHPLQSSPSSASATSSSSMMQQQSPSSFCADASRALVCRGLRRSRPNAATQLLKWLSAAQKALSTTAAVPNMTALPALCALDSASGGALADAAFARFVDDSWIACTRYDLYRHVVLYRAATEPAYLLPLQLLKPTARYFPFLSNV